MPDDTAEHLVSYALDGPIALIGLNRPAKRNALSSGLLAQIDAAALRAADEARAAVIFGHGDHFCAGLDLAELFQTLSGKPRTRRRWRPPVFGPIARGQIPFVAALSGAVIGGGLELAAACQVRVADSTTFFALPEGQRGIFVGGGGSVRIARLISVARMQDMMLTGRVVTAAEAVSWNLASYVVDKGEALARAKVIAHRIAENSEAANFAIVNGLSRIDDLSQDDGMFMEWLVSESLIGEDTVGRVGAFVAKTAKPIGG